MLQVVLACCDHSPHLFPRQSIFAQLKLSPSLKKVLFATALGSVALALTAHHMKRRGRKRKQATAVKDEQKQVGIPEALIRSGRPSSLRRGEFHFNVITGGFKQAVELAHNFVDVFVGWLIDIKEVKRIKSSWFIDMLVFP